ncbi:MAG: hypothetical protein ACP5VC_18710 [Bryobacteraceae bacterium]
MMLEFEDHDEEGRDLLLEYLRRHPPTPCSACLGRGCDLCSHTGLAEYMPRQGPAPEPSKPGCLWRLFGHLYLAWLRWRYRRHD